MAQLKLTDARNVETIKLTLGESVDFIRPIDSRIGGTFSFNVGGNHPLIAGHTYEVEVLFRPRGDGISTPDKCSSIGFITWWNNWASSYSSIHYSGQAYQDRGHFTRLFYRFTPGEDVQPDGTQLFFIVNNGWACGSDNQTIDLYYYRYQDMTNPSIIDENGINASILEIEEKATGKNSFVLLSDVGYSSDNVSVSGTSFGRPFQKNIFGVPSRSFVDLVPTCNILSEGYQSFQVGQIRKFYVSSIGRVNIEIQSKPGFMDFSTVFYDNWEEYTLSENGYSYAYRRTVSNEISSVADTESMVYIFKNADLVGQSSSSVNFTLNIQVIPGDIIYVKNVFKNSGSIIYKKDEYGESKVIAQKTETVTNGWNTTTTKYWDEDITDYVATQSAINNLIANGDTTYGYITEAGNDVLDNTGLGATNTGIISCGISLKLNRPNDYDDLINIIRSV